MQLIGKRILAEKLQQNNTTDAGIILSDSSNLNKHQAKVLQVGPDCTFVTVGDVLKYNANSAVHYPLNGKHCVFLREDQDVLFKVGND